MRRLALVFALLASPAAAQLAVTADLSAGPSLTSLGAGGTLRAGGVPIPLGRVDFPAAVGVDVRGRVGVRSGAWGGRVGVGYLSASDVYDGASLFGQRSVDVAFVLASAEVTLQGPVRGVEAVLGVGPELRVVLDEGTEREGLLALTGDVARSHAALGGSVGARFAVGGVAFGPELRAGIALTPLADDGVEAAGGLVRLDGDLRVDHVALALTVGME